MASILKITCGGQIYRVVLESGFDFEAVDVAVRRVLPGFATADTTFPSEVTDEVQPLAPETFEAFTATGKQLGSGQVVLRLEVPQSSEEQPELQTTRTSSVPLPIRSRKQATISPSAWQEDTRPLDDLVARVQQSKNANGKGKRRSKAFDKASEDARPVVVIDDSMAGGDTIEASGEISDEAQLAGDAPAGGPEKESCVSCGEDETSDEHVPDEDDYGTDSEVVPGGFPPSPSSLHRSSSCPAHSLPALLLEPQAAPAAHATEDLPPDPQEVWPPTPDSTPPASPRAGYPDVPDYMMDYYDQQQQFVWVPVFVPVF